MTAVSARRAFLRGKFRKNDPVRPFGAAGWQEFCDVCDRCDACAEACPDGIIAFDEDGFPVLDAQAGACTFCGDCTNACPTDALDVSRPWPWMASVGTTCLSTNGVQCRICEDQCDARAIRFRLALGGRSTPQIDMEACTGCAECVAPCPAGAISLTRAPRKEETMTTC